MSDEIENDTNIIQQFHGVYLLLCENVKYKGRTYIGYTVNPVRRLKRHNAGKDFGGAKKTSNKGPWNMVFIIHGFPSSRMALRFEWAWQNPEVDQSCLRTSRNDTALDHCLIVALNMLQTSPWNRLPLVVRWLDDKCYDKYSSRLNSVPTHMIVSFGPVRKSQIRYECNVCFEYVKDDDKVVCIEENCDLIAHVICLAKKLSCDNKILPVNGVCPVCNKLILWGDIIKKKTLLS